MVVFFVLFILAAIAVFVSVVSYSDPAIPLCFAIVFLVLGIIAGAADDANKRSVDPTDKSAQVRSGMDFFTDYGTGCQYLSVNKNQLIPRMDLKASISASSHEDRSIQCDVGGQDRPSQSHLQG